MSVTAPHRDDVGKDEDRAGTHPQPRRRRRWIPPMVVLLALLALWTAVWATVDTLLLPNAWEVVVFMWDEVRGDTVAKDNLYQSLAISFARLGLGLVIAMLLGTVLGVVMGRSRKMAAVLDDFVIADLNMPYLVWALLIPLWLGFDFWTPVVVVVLGAIPFVIVNVAEGVRNVPRELLDMARSFDVRQRGVLRNVILPSLAPFLFAAFRFALSLGWKALVLAELFGSDRGMGWMIKFWYDAHRVTALIGYALFFVAIAIVIDRVIIAGISARVFRWQPKGEVGSSAVAL
jgi:ABC-type nitrate/sulfonate/bicarbonate transport system permease component